MVATSDYGDFHKMARRFIMAGMLGSSAQVYVLTFSKLYSLVTSSWIRFQLAKILQWNAWKYSEKISGHTKQDDG